MLDKLTIAMSIVSITNVFLSRGHSYESECDNSILTIQYHFLTIPIAINIRTKYSKHDVAPAPFSGKAQKAKSQ